jgi:hypothetical protein
MQIKNIFTLIIFISVSCIIIILTSIRDNSMPMRKIDCRKLVGFGSWQIESSSAEIVEYCRKGVNNDNSSKTSYR